ncbi:MAG: hypothetical protein CSB55_08550 [Candidatus Cloacimonadota bacterium]|nr:MAG: hypothetical protein CSB55_08550 [Candidatus Cloacimonadota bacterium]
MLIKTANTKKKHKEEKIPGTDIQLITASGINPAEREMINDILKLKKADKIVICGNRTGISSMVAATLFPYAEITAMNVDQYYTNKLERNFALNEFETINVVCSGEEDEMKNADVVMLQVAGEAISKDFTADRIQQAAKAMKKGGKLYINSDKKHDWISIHLKKSFGEFTQIKSKFSKYIAKKKKDLAKERIFDEEFQVTAQGKKPLIIRTLPGVFAHRRIDSGARAMIETITANKGDRILDMGCGSGVIGISLAKNTENSHVVFIDSNSRAIRVTEENCKLNNIENYETILSSSGINRPGKFDLFAGNPPYFGNFKIAELFINTAWANLAVGGEAYFVAKSSDYLEELLIAKFGNCEVTSRRGYNILRSTK